MAVLFIVIKKTTFSRKQHQNIINKLSNILNQSKIIAADLYNFDHIIGMENIDKAPQYDPVVVDPKGYIVTLRWFEINSISHKCWLWRYRKYVCNLLDDDKSY